MNGQLIPFEERGDSIPLLRDRLQMGSAETCDITLEYPTVPLLACELEWNCGYWFLRSAANDAPQAGRFLLPGDLIEIGECRFVIDYVPHPVR